MKAGGPRSSLAAPAFIFCAQDWIRTSTSLRTLRPEHSASTNFATWACSGIRAAKISAVLITNNLFILLYHHETATS